MKKGIKITGIVLLVLFLILTIVYVVNEKFIQYYEDAEYDRVNFAILQYLNFIEAYKAVYNNGNVYYDKGNYNKAIEEYEKALKLHPKEDDECKIRINLALAKLKALPTEYEEKEDIDKALEILADAKEVLTENGCAKKNGREGHSEDAQELEDDIEDLEKKLKDAKSDPKQDPDEPDEPQEKPKDPKNIEEELKKIKQQGIEERQKQIEMNKRFDDIDGYVYYSGKNW